MIQCLPGMHKALGLMEGRKGVREEGRREGRKEGRKQLVLHIYGCHISQPRIENIQRKRN
jgi:hypothetical protein